MNEKDVIWCHANKKYWLEVKGDKGWVRHGKTYRTLKGVTVAYIMLVHNTTRKVARDYYKWGLKVWQAQKKALN